MKLALTVAIQKLEIKKRVLIIVYGFDPEICGLFRIVENGKTVGSDLSLSDDIFISLTMHIALVMSGIPEEPV